MAVLSLSEIIKLKKHIEPYGYTVHVHDACGAQSFGLEKIRDEVDDKVFEALQEFFDPYKLDIHFYNDDKQNFTIINKTL